MAHDAPPRAVVDIGSNSIRLVVFAGPARLPRVLLNEKVAANLGRSLSVDGLLPARAMDVGLRGLARFARLLTLMGIANPRVVATAAVRDAGNGPAFLDRVRALGLHPELLSGAEEAAASASGVLSAFPNAEGIVGDLGGGSLELVEVAGGLHGRGASFPLGTLRLPALRESGARTFARRLRAMLGPEWAGAAEGRSFFLVGGTWRALTQLAMHEDGYLLADPHGYAMPPEEATRIARLTARASAKRLRAVPDLPGSRIASLPHAAALLEGVVRHLRPARLVTSSFGLREGLLYAALDSRVRAQDPLLVVARDHAARAGCASVDGERLAQWIAPVFAAEPAGDARLRTAACLLAAVARLPERHLRPARAVEIALRERWVAIDGAGRGAVAATLLGYLGERTMPPAVERLAGPDLLARAARWGAAMRLGEKLAGPASAVLADTALASDRGRLVLRLPAAHAALYGEGAEQQHRLLAQALGLEPAVVAEA
jgi:exopolyphosphatase / guanosine-5'-triphosphate,3'-diphosphate pyrophosphatase